MGGVWGAASCAVSSATMSGDMVVVDPWFDLRSGDELAQRQVKTLSAELRRELTRGHSLYKVKFEVIARCRHCDEILVLADDHFVFVHLGWPPKSLFKPKPPFPGLPRTQWFDTAEEAELEADTHA